jgi:hypothetical protein
LSSHTASDSFTRLCEEIIVLNKSIRFVGLANHLGTLLTTSYRNGLTPVMTREETKHYALQAVLRAAIREDFVSKLGRLKHSIGTYDKLIRATVPIITEDNLQAKFFLLLSFDIGTDVRAIIENELLPYIDKNLRLFK